MISLLIKSMRDNHSYKSKVVRPVMNDFPKKFNGNNQEVHEFMLKIIPVHVHFSITTDFHSCLPQKFNFHCKLVCWNCLRGDLRIGIYIENK